MRLTGAAAIAFVLALTLSSASARQDNHRRLDGREIFRYDTFGDEQLWTGVLRLHEAIPAVSPAKALEAGLKVDADALPPAVVDALEAGQVDLDDPAVTLALLQVNAVVGLVGKVDESGQLTSVGITCALCHSNVDNSFKKGVGKRLDGWANHDLDVGLIVGLAPGLDPDLKTEFSKWGPGKYDPRHHAFDGMNLVGLNASSVPVVLPAIYGLERVGFETYTGDGPISYWNSYVGVGQMGGRGNFFDPRIGLFIRQKPDLVTPKLKALLEYQLSLRSPAPPDGSFNREAAARGNDLFDSQAGCRRCHSGPAYTDVLDGRLRDLPVLHDPGEVGTDSEYAGRSATGKYRTTPLRALWQHAPYFHDGSAPDLPAVVDHYDEHMGLGLTDDQKADLVEFLKSL
jgi:hypothetical protein